MTPSETHRTQANFLQAQMHIGRRGETPAEVARAVLAQAGFDLEACVAMDPSVALLFEAKPGLLQDIIQFARENGNG